VAMVSRELLLDRHLIHDDVAGDPAGGVGHAAAGAERCPVDCHGSRHDNRPLSRPKAAVESCVSSRRMEPRQPVLPPEVDEGLACAALRGWDPGGDMSAFLVVDRIGMQS